MQIVGEVIIGTGLLICGIQDIKYMQVSRWMLVIIWIAFAFSGQLFDNMSFYDRIWGIVMGLVFLAISKLTNGQVGLGDGWMIGALGLGLGIWYSMEVLCCAFFLSAFFAGVLLIFRRNCRNKRIPFIPFIFLGYLGVIVL